MACRWVSGVGLSLMGLIAGTGCGASGADDDSAAGAGGTAGSSGGYAGMAGSGMQGAMGGSSGASGGTGGDLPDVAPDVRLVDLTPDQKGEVCDWYADLYGGYGVTTQCPAGGSTQTYASKDVCVAAGLKYSCKAATVDDFTTCMVASRPSGGCDIPDPECNGLYCM
jgi:hypothetical protein